jgi:hypothetical protein
MHQYSNGKLSTNSVLCLFNVLIKPLGVIFLYQTHSLVIQLWDILMNLFSLFIRLVREMRSPMTKIRGNYKYCVFVVEVFRQQFSILPCKFIINDTNYNRNNLHFLFGIEEFSDQWHMHLQTVLLFLLFFG